LNTARIEHRKAVAADIRDIIITSPAITSGSHRHRMGMRPLPESEWLLTSPDYGARMARKLALLQAVPETVSAVLAESTAAQQEALHTICEHLGKWHPQHFQWRKELVSCPDLRRQRLDGDAPLLIAARLVEEDLCLMQADTEGNYRLTAAALASPSLWQASDKIGQELLEIHDPVEGLHEQIGTRMRHFFEHAAAGIIYVRGNWFIHPSAKRALFPGEPLSLQGITPANIEHRLFFRCERQTLRKLHTTGAWLFSIHVKTEPLARLRQDADLARRIRILLSNPETLRYRAWSVTPLHSAITACLEKMPT